MIQVNVDYQRRNIESAIVGSMALLSEAAEFAMTELSGSEFSFLDLLTQFRAVCRLTERGIAVDPITLTEELIRTGEFEAAGGTIGVFEVIEAVPHSAHCRYYVEQLQAMRQRDQLRRLSERLGLRAQDPMCEPTSIIDETLNALEALRAGNAESELITAAESIEAFDQRSNDPTALIQTGLPELDRQLRGGLRAGQLAIIGGRPGLGKSALIAQIILNAARLHRRGMIAPLEMTAGEIA